jgi:hypothetical protein
VFDPETGVPIAPIPSIEGEPLQDTEATKGVYKAEGEDITGKVCIECGYIFWQE